jgi:MoxR-like ATPase
MSDAELDPLAAPSSVPPAPPFPPASGPFDAVPAPVGTGGRDPRAAILSVRDEVAKVVVGQDGTLSGLVAALLARGHVLLEGVPGVAKTLIVKALAAALDLDVKRVQFTPDLMPSDVTGQLILDGGVAGGGGFRFRPGPVFTNVLLADEINRTPPKTQAALLESMEERQVTVEGETHPLPDPFIVIATQNPVEYEGTYPLPEAQLDRFMVRVSLGYPTAQQESDMLMDHAESDRVLDLEPVADVAGILAAQTAAAAVHGSEALRRYVVAISDATRADPRVELGASPRAGLMLFRAAKAYAALDGRDHALPDDVQKLAGAVLTHRLLLSPGTGADERAVVVRDALERVPAL